MAVDVARSAHVAAATEYAEDVVGGRIVVGKWTRLACRRQLDDLERAEASWRYEWDEERAEHICRFVELLPHVKGEWARRREMIKLQPWQQFVLTTVFGWVDRETRYRRYKASYLEVAKKNTKSTMSAGVSLYMLAADGEEGADVFDAATTQKQARIVFEISQAMVRKAPGFRRRYGVEPHAHAISVEQSNSKLEALSAEANSLEGVHAHCAVIDELHAHKRREVHDNLESSTAARTQPLLWLISTAGYNRAGICYEIHQYVKKILQGVLEDDTYFGIIYAADVEDDWSDEAAWKKANPNLGVSVYVDGIARECAKAQQLPSAQTSFLTKRLNLWVNADVAWMDMARWDACGDEGLDPSQFEGEECWLGLDLASRVDIAALLVLIRQGKDHYIFGRYYLPEETVESSTNSQYAGWVRDGRLITTPGNSIDFEYIEADMLDLATRFNVMQVGFDPYQATQFTTRMAKEGLTMVEVRATVLNFSEPMKILEALVLDGKLHHDGDPALTWMVSNVVCHRDNKDNIYPRKEREENKIDGLVALLMCLNRSMLYDEDGVPAYDDSGRGLVVI